MESTSFQYEDNRGLVDLNKKKKKKPKKLRSNSINLSKSPSIRLAKYQSKHFVVDFSTKGESSNSNPAKPSCSDAKTETFQRSTRKLMRRASMKLKKPMRKVISNSERSSLSKRSQMRTESKFDKESPNFSKEIQASPITRKSRGSSSSNKTSKVSAFSRQKNFNSSTMSDTKSKSCLVKKLSQVPQNSDSSIERATFSSTVKDSKFPNLVELEAEGSSTIKICSFKYCSLHGHHHNTVPPLKRLISIRKHLLKSQRNMKKERPFSNRENRNIKKEMQTCQLVSNVLETETKPRIARSREKVEKTLDFDNVQENTKQFSDLPKLGQHASMKFEEPEESSLECSYCTVRKCDVLVFKSTNMEDEAFGYLCNKGRDGDTASESSGKSLKEKGDVPVFERIGSVCNEGCDTGFELSRNSLKVCDMSGDNRVEKFSSSLDNNEEEATKGSGTITYASHDELLEEQQAMGNQEDKKEFLTNEDFKQLKNQKYVRMWHLMYKHAVKGSNGVNNEQQVEHSDNENLLEENKINAVKLVKKAFDEILLPEIQDLSSDDQLSTSDDIGSEKELGEKIHIERTIPPIEETSLKQDEKTEQKVPKRWNNLRKIILLKRFVKAIEKARRIDNWIPPQSLSCEPDLEAEKVRLRNHIMEERKNADEFMFDYAIQKIIHTLAPAQRRKVALLVEAFETVLPISGMKCSFKSNLKDSSQADQDQVFRELIPLCGGNPEILLRETPPAITDHNQAEEANDALLEKQKNPEKILEVKETSSECHCIKTELETHKPLLDATDEDLGGEQNTTINIDDMKSKAGSISICSPKKSNHRFCNMLKQNENVQESLIEVNSSFNSKPSNADCELYGDKESDTNYVIASNSEQQCNSEVVSSASFEPAEGKNEPQAVFLKGFQKLEDTQLDKKKYMKLWYFVYKHMVSEVAVEEENNVAARADQGESEFSFYCHSLPNSRKDNFRRFEAIKLVEKAIDETHLPKNEDNSFDDQSSNGDSSQEQKENLVETEPLKILKESMQREAKISNFVEPEAKMAICSNSTTAKEEQLNPKIGSKPNQQKAKGWSNLKKMVLLKRFINALEKERRLNAGEPRYLPVEVRIEAEKVHLRHQDIEERKSADEWMLDYALQQAVTKLTPARKRKVELLVEAFETVTPNFQS